MGNTFYFGWEVALIQRLQEHMGPVGVKVAGLFTLFGEEVVLIALFGLLYWCLDKKLARIIGTNMMIALTFAPMIKNIALRRRPYFDNEAIKCLKPVKKGFDIYDISAQGYSFPSMHSLNAAVMYGGMTALCKKKASKVILILIVILVGMSRVALGVHYPTDVLTGWGLGLLCTTVITDLQSRIKNRNLFHLLLFAAALTGVFFCHTKDYFTGLGLMAGFFLSIPFEEKYVSFKETKKLPECICRLVCGVLLYFLLNTILKAPFTYEFLEGGSMAANLVRSARYLIIMFVLNGVFPMCFGALGRLLRIETGK